MITRETLNYVEFPAKDLAATKRFFTAVFGWRFVDYGEAYTAFSGAGLDGGFYRAALASTPATGGALLVFYSADIAATQARIERHGGVVSRPLFEFPGGCRFHFVEPSGNELAVWSESPAPQNDRTRG
ncbi:VOC family protein [Marinobacter sp. X15-166B]|uniref:VOC family protein n=1 Tax=Marinobacter sp. X15-166B TaxID=1897620 RepID=UPI00085CD6F5|nr:VOC family protein [Marinobacter sp. X15-166B]OEY66783.1 glyoxalase [Marinobacter sp. X15-166B]